MKVTKLALVVSMLALCVQGWSQLVEITIEPYVIHDGSIAELDGMTTYHVYAVCTNPSDEMSAIYGDATAPLSLTSTDGFYQNALGSNVGWSINPAFFVFFPTIEYDSWVTIGAMNADEVTGQPNTTGMDVPFETFNSGGNLLVNSENGGSWFTLFGDTQAQAGDDLKVLIAQLTATNDAVISGNFNLQVFVNGVQANAQLFWGVPFSSVEGAVFGCMDPDATNYNPDATQEGGEPCIYPCSLTLSVFEIVQNSCPGVGDGEITVAASGAQLGVIYGIDSNTPSLAVGSFDDLTAGTYTISAIDGAGCEASIEVELVAPNPIVITASMIEAVSCNGGADAVISGSSSGGTGAMSYSLSETFADSNADLYFGDLSPGLYTVYAMDENGCTSSSSPISIANPQALTVTVLGGQAAILDATCSDSEDGVVWLVTIGGVGTVASMQFSSNGVDFAPGNVLNLNPGTYTFYAMDVNGCIGQTANQYVVGAPDPIVITGNANGILCNGDSNGAVSFGASGGNGGLTFSFNGGEDGDVTSYGDLASGDYVVVATDVEGCTAEATFTVADVAAVEVSATATAVSCNGDTDGMIEVSASGGTNLFEYSDNGSDFGSSPTFMNLGAGTYTIYAHDSNGCTASIEVEVATPNPITWEIYAVEEPTCSNGFVGTMAMDAFGGTGGQYELYVAGVDFPFASSFEWTSGAGTYEFDLIDVNGCVASGQYSLEGQPSMEGFEPVVEEPTCNGDADGSLQPDPDFDFTTWSVAWSGPTSGTADVFDVIEGLAAGTYALDLASAEYPDCVSTVEVEVGEPAPVEIEVDAAGPNCPDELTGLLFASAFETQGEVTWNLNGIAVSEGPSLSLFGLPAGTFAVGATDAAGCSAQAVAVLDAPEALDAIDAAIVQPTTFTNGAISLDAPAGTSVSWFDETGVEFASGNEVTGLGYGIYAAELTSAAGCTTTMEYTLNFPGCGLVDASDWPEGSSGLYPTEATTWYLGASPTENWVLRTPELIYEGNVPYVVSEFVPEMLLNVPVGTVGDLNLNTAVDAGEAMCVEWSGSPIESGVFDVSVTGTLYIHVFGSQFPIPNFTFSKQVIVQASSNPVPGCTYALALNFNEFATLDDGSCEFELAPSDEGACYFDADDNGEVGSSDLLLFLGAYATVCP